MPYTYIGYESARYPEYDIGKAKHEYYRVQ
jgi:hypothetical protein